VAKAFLLNESDRKVLARLISEEAHRLRREPANPDGGRADHEEMFPPEVYVVLTPSGGIPALAEGADTGTAAGAGDLPGFADCSIYKVVTTNPPQLSPVSGLSRRVYNLSFSNFPGNAWALAVRDKFGNWFLMGPVEEPFTGTGTGTCSTMFTSLVGWELCPAEAPTHIKIIKQDIDLVTRCAGEEYFEYVPLACQEVVTGCDEAGETVGVFMRFLGRADDQDCSETSTGTGTCG
jgi:hypothetical protein